VDLIQHLYRQREFSIKTFGPGQRTQGVLDHIRKELREIEAKPLDLEEWVDVILLALDGAWRAGFEPVEITAAMMAKQIKNEHRSWPDWRTADPNKAIEHVRKPGVLDALIASAGEFSERTRTPGPIQTGSRNTHA
jgi:hypothetical protein